MRDDEFYELCKIMWANRGIVDMPLIRFANREAEKRGTRLWTEWYNKARMIRDMSGK